MRLLLAPPPPIDAAGFVPRTRLLSQMLDSAAPPITWVQAPAGSGKSTLLAQWAEATTSPVAWLTADITINNPDRFMSMLAAAADRLGSTIASGAIDPQGVQHEDFVDIVVTAIEAIDSTVAIVIDDAEKLVNPVVLGALDRLVERRPVNLRVLIASRRRIEVALSRWRVAGIVLEIGPQDLAFDQDETVAALSASIVPAEIRRVSAAVQRITNGWAAGVGLSRLSLGRRPMPADRPLDTVVRDAIGQNTSEFFIDEMLANQPPDRVDFLLRTSILSELTPEICDGLVQSAWSLRLLSEMDGDGLFLTRVSGSPPVWRYHDLFAAALRAAFEQQRGASSVREHHRQVSRQYERSGAFGQALHHAVEAQEFGRAGALVILAAPEITQSGQIGVLAGWLSALLTGPSTGSDELIYWQCYLHMKMGDYAAFFALLPVLQQLWEGATDPLRATRLASLKSAKHFHRVEFELAQAEAACAIETGRLLHPAETTVARTTMLGTLFHSGRVAEADRFQRSVVAADAAGELVYRLYAGEIAFANCELGKAAELFQNALVRYDSHVSFSYLCFLLTLSDIYREWNDLERGDETTARADAYERSLSHQGTRWYVERALALQCVSQHDWPGALLHANQMLRTISSVASSDKHAYVRAFHALAMWKNGNPEPACILRAENSIPKQSTIWDIRNALITASLMEYLGDRSDALGLLGRLRQSAERDGRSYDVLRSSIMQAGILARAGDRRLAQESLLRAIPLANRGGCQHIVVSQGPELLEVLMSLTHHVGARRLLESLNAPSVVAEPGAVWRPFGVSDRALTPREQEILQLAERGLSNAEIGAALGISVPTVKRHLTNIFGKLGVRNRTEATRWLRHDIVSTASSATVSSPEVPYGSRHPGRS
ncbi:MAG: hypothetical protein E6R14_11145 [Thermomicrobiales bacterium]|nr:MAG: hypothetical protein E6R14_11145 [Thermomicrobiales bacterium]